MGPLRIEIETFNIAKECPILRSISAHCKRKYALE